MYEYRARAIRVLDGDTIHAELDLGLDVRIRLTLRLHGIDAPELREEGGHEARDYLNAALLGVDTFTVRTVKDRREKYGRYLADIFVADRHINANMVTLGLAAPYVR